MRSPLSDESNYQSSEVSSKVGCVSANQSKFLVFPVNIKNEAENLSSSDISELPVADEDESLSAHSSSAFCATKFLNKMYAPGCSTTTGRSFYINNSFQSKPANTNASVLMARLQNQSLRYDSASKKMTSLGQQMRQLRVQSKNGLHQRLEAVTPITAVNHSPNLINSATLQTLEN